MKIVIVAPSHRSFIKDFLPNTDENILPEGYFGAPIIGLLIHEFLKSGNDVTAITTTNSYNRDFTTHKFSYENFTWIVVPSRKHSFRFNAFMVGRMVDFYAYERRAMQEEIMKQKPDFIHAHWSYEFAASAIHFDIPNLVTIHDNAYKVLKYMTNIYRFGRLLMSEWVLNKARFVSTVSPYMENYAKGRCNQVKIIPNPTLITESKETVKKRIFTKLTTINSPILMMVSNGWGKLKNSNACLDAFVLIKKEIPGATLSLYGHGTELHGPAYSTAQQMGLQGITFFGAVNHKNLLQQLKAGHLLIHPSLEESFGVVLVEAMAEGVPALGGKDSGAVPWVVKESRLLVDVNKPEAIADRALAILSNPTQYQELALKCYENSRKRFSSESVARQYIDYYHEIIKQW
jgi:glycosyltransferase involved in cell wall biosynthesis